MMIAAPFVEKSTTYGYIIKVSGDESTQVD